MFNVSLPVLVSVRDWGEPLVFTVWLSNVRLVADRPRAGAVPVPDNATVCGLPGASSVTAIDADLAPVEVGVKITVTVQLAFTARVDPQVWLFEN